MRLYSPKLNLRSLGVLDVNTNINDAAKKGKPPSGLWFAHRRNFPHIIELLKQAGATWQK